MATLFVLRHAKSDWSGADLISDEARPLAKRGRKEAAAVGRFLSEGGRRPTLVLASPARRVEETLARAMAAGAWRAPVQVVADLYGGGAASYLAAVRRADAADPLLIAGHEPDCSEFVAALIGGGGIVMPTAALAAIACPGSAWSELSPGSGSLSYLVTGRLLAR